MKLLRAGPARLLRRESGQALVEAALTLPQLCAFLYMLIELCLAYYSYCMISESARQGTRYAMVHGAACKDGEQCFLYGDGRRHQQLRDERGLAQPGRRHGNGEHHIPGRRPESRQPCAGHGQLCVSHQSAVTAAQLALNGKYIGPLHHSVAPHHRASAPVSIDAATRASRWVRREPVRVLVGIGHRNHFTRTCGGDKSLDACAHSFFRANDGRAQFAFDRGTLPNRTKASSWNRPAAEALPAGCG